MQESLFYASQEMKRAEHLLYVSLKYTRTGDVIKSLVSRLIACFDFVIDGMLEIEEEKGSIVEVPNSPFAKVTVLKRIYKDNEEMCVYLDYYLLLRKISRSNSEASHEFRRNLVLRVKVLGRQLWSAFKYKSISSRSGVFLGLSPLISSSRIFFSKSGLIAFATL